jgi:hypothetical protein
MVPLRDAARQEGRGDTLQEYRKGDASVKVIIIDKL